MRFLYTMIYLRGLQLWRALAYLTGLGLTWAIVIASLGVLVAG